MSSHYRFKNHYTTMPGDVEPNDAFAMKVVAVVGKIGDWAAYWGPPSWSNENVARKGCKLSAEAAVPLFPVLRNLCYRR